MRTMIAKMLCMCMFVLVVLLQLGVGVTARNTDSFNDIESEYQFSKWAEADVKLATERGFM